MLLSWISLSNNSIIYNNLLLLLLLLLINYCAVHKHAHSEAQKPTDNCVFATVNHLNGPLRKQNFALTGSKGHSL